ncbi:GD17719 [Drosophila simulans]|uniref:GD17719 n=1 Tax=Drosophila simulans TaxID=7240 RepID=B4NSV2_DROSI|nr:GD17719 [Drosophila simulans]
MVAEVYRLLGQANLEPRQALVVSASGPPASNESYDFTVAVYRPCQRIAFLQKIFWSLWQEEHLSLLQQRSKGRTPNLGLVVDDIVLVKDENLPGKVAFGDSR